MPGATTFLTAPRTATRLLGTTVTRISVRRGRIYAPRGAEGRAEPVEMAWTAQAGAQTLRRWWLTRRLHIDLLRVCSAFRAAA
ncbi:hypothetical protein ABZ128_24310 [Streptomyces sp. NPDC006326]|uniref:hypothetical protein n=1 Tax=Streptomyces sp. NPDC006326 TaxID=3156752 RepID=UPI0033A4EFD0